jgi:folate-binding protein YgfZ
MHPTLLIDRSDRARIELSGAHAAATLNGLVTSDVTALRPGQGQYGAALTAKGKIVADVVVLMLDDRLQVHASPAAAPGLQAMLSKFVNPRFATRRDVTDGTAELTLVGESAANVIALAASESVRVEDLEALSPFSHVAVVIGEAAIRIVRLPSIGLRDASMYAVIAQRDQVDAVGAALRNAGASGSDAAALDTLRVESGFPEWGIDMDENTLPQEANLDDVHAVSYTKGCYIGQETVARIHFRGHVNRSLRRLAFPDGILPPRGATLQDSEHRSVGDLRSTALSSTAGAIGIGMVRREIEDGTAIDVHWEGGSARAVITGKAKGAIE